MRFSSDGPARSGSSFLLLLLCCIFFFCSCFPLSADGAASGVSEDSAISPFTISIPDSALSELQSKLALASFPSQDANGGSGWERGTNVSFLRSLIDEWRSGYNWREREADLNRLNHSLTQIDGYSLHFIHTRSNRSDALPLLLIHGWPGSFLECEKVRPLLTAPANSALTAFHLICPSLPGYAFSSAAASQRTNARTIAALFIRLMHRLGYERYIVQGGDWGSFIASHIATMDPQHCRGLHLNAAPVAPPIALFATHHPLRAVWRGLNTILDLTLPWKWRFDAEEVAVIDRPLTWIIEETAYFHQQVSQADNSQSLTEQEDRWGHVRREREGGKHARQIEQC